MNSGLDDPEATWPGVLLLEVPAQGLVIGEMRSLAGLSGFDKRDLAARVLPNHIRASKADRFAWAMPAWRNDAEPRVECLVVVMGEPRHTEAHIVDVLRGIARTRRLPPASDRRPLCRRVRSESARTARSSGVFHHQVVGGH